MAISHNSFQLIKMRDVKSNKHEGYCNGQALMQAIALCRYGLDTHSRLLIKIGHGVPHPERRGDIVKEADLQSLIKKLNLPSYVEPSIQNTPKSTPEKKSQKAETFDDVIKRYLHDLKSTEKQRERLMTEPLGEPVIPYDRCAPAISAVDLNKIILLAKHIQIEVWKKAQVERVKPQELLGNFSEVIATLLEIDNLIYLNMFAQESDGMFPEFIREEMRTVSQPFEPALELLSPSAHPVVLVHSAFDQMIMSDLQKKFEEFERQLLALPDEKEEPDAALPFAVNIAVDEHTISVGYNRKKQKWIAGHASHLLPLEVETKKIGITVYAFLNCRMRLTGAHTEIHLHKNSNSGEDIYLLSAVQHKQLVEPDCADSRKRDIANLGFLSSGQIKDGAKLNRNIRFLFFANEKVAPMLAPIFKSAFNTVITHDKLTRVDDVTKAPLFNFCCHFATDANFLEKMIEAGARLDDRTKNEEGLTPLSEAVLNNGRQNIVKFLLSKKANPNLCSSYGSSPLYTAACVERREIISILCEAGADLEKAIDIARNNPEEKAVLLEEKYKASPLKLLTLHRDVLIAEFEKIQVFTRFYFYDFGYLLGDLEKWLKYALRFLNFFINNMTRTNPSAQSALNDLFNHLSSLREYTQINKKTANAENILEIAVQLIVSPGITKHCPSLLYEQMTEMSKKLSEQYFAMKKASPACEFKRAI